MEELIVATSAAIQAVDVTDLVDRGDWPDGFLWISSPHTTTALFIGEGDPDMLADYERVAQELFLPFEPFRHRRNENPNAAAHLVSSVAGGQLLLRVVDGRLALGTYQRLILLELDGPKDGRRLEMESITPQERKG